MAKNKFYNAEDFMTYLQNPNLKLSMNNSWIEIDDPIYINWGEGISLNNTHITINKNATFTIGSFSEMRGRIIAQANSKIIIGNRLICNGNIFIHSAEQGTIKIGDNCLFANPQIYNSDFHAYYDVETGNRMNLPKNVEIGDYVWLGLNSLLLKGTLIQDHSIVGAGSIVSKKFTLSNVIISGNPGKVVKENISWSRKIYDKAPLIKFLSTDFIDEFILNAKKLNHTKVISMGIPYYSEWEQMNQQNFYFFYYLCRSILLSKINQLRQDGFVKVDIHSVTLSDLFQIFFNAYNLSEKEKLCLWCFCIQMCKYVGG